MKTISNTIKAIIISAVLTSGSYACDETDIESDQVTVCAYDCDIND